MENDPQIDVLLVRQNYLLNELDIVETQIDNILGAAVLRECAEIEGLPEA